MSDPLDPAPCGHCGGSGREPAAGAVLGRIELPLHTVSVANHPGTVREHARRRKDHRGTAALVLRARLGIHPPLPVVVRVTRIAPRALDAHDNLRGCLKAVVDGIADWLELTTDADPRVRWIYDQRPGKPRQYAVLVEVRAADANGA